MGNLGSGELLVIFFVALMVLGPNKLPEAARRYLERVAEVCGVPIDLVSTGPDRNETIVLRHPLKG